MVGDEDHGALLDRHGDPLRRRVRALLQVLPSVPRTNEERSSTAPRARAAPSRDGSTTRCSSTARSGTRTTSRCSTASTSLVKSPGVPGDRPLVRRGARAGDPGVVGGRARLPTGSPRRVRSSSASPARTASRRRPRSSARSSKRPGATWLWPATSALRSRRWSTPTGWSASCRRSSSRTCTSSSCDVAVLLNLEPDHLDRYASFDEYRDAKLRIFERARAKVVPRGLGLEGIEFSADDPLPAEPADPRRAQPRERRGRDRRRSGGRDRRRRDRRGAAHVPGHPAPARARRRARRRPLRQRQQGDERRRRAARARRVRGGAGAPDPRRLAEGRGLRAARGRDRSERALCPPDRRRGDADRRGRRRRRRRDARRGGRACRAAGRAEAT